jgi:hypothetical protein
MTVVIDGTTGIDTVQDGAVVPADLSTGGPSWDSSGNLSFNSGYGSAARAYGCRAWVNFNGTGTVAIRASGNVSSITDNGTGDYTVNLTTAMPDTNYAATGSVRRTSSAAAEHSLLIGSVPGSATTYTASAFRVFSYDRVNNAAYDTELVVIAVFR